MKQSPEVINGGLTSKPNAPVAGSAFGNKTRLLHEYFTVSDGQTKGKKSRQPSIANLLIQT